MQKFDKGEQYELYYMPNVNKMLQGVRPLNQHHIIMRTLVLIMVVAKLLHNER